MTKIGKPSSPAALAAAASVASVANAASASSSPAHPLFAFSTVPTLSNISNISTVSPRKRSWTSTLHGRTPFRDFTAANVDNGCNGGGEDLVKHRTHFTHRPSSTGSECPDYPECPDERGDGDDLKEAPDSQPSQPPNPRQQPQQKNQQPPQPSQLPPPQQPQQPQQPDLQSLLHRYHSLALEHYRQTKRRRLERDQSRKYDKHEKYDECETLKGQNGQTMSKMRIGQRPQRLPRRNPKAQRSLMKQLKQYPSLPRDGRYSKKLGPRHPNRQHLQQQQQKVTSKLNELTKSNREQHSKHTKLHQLRLEQLTTLHQMASDTLEYCKEVLASEEEVGRDLEGERLEQVERENEEDEEKDVMMEEVQEVQRMEEVERVGNVGNMGNASHIVAENGDVIDQVEDLDVEWQRAVEEKDLAEEFLRMFGSSRKGDTNKFKSDNDSRIKHSIKHNRSDNRNNRNDDPKEKYPTFEYDDTDKIGGIPKRFLDLSHFPKLQTKFPEDECNNGNNCNTSGSHIIDCTDEVLHRSPRSPLRRHSSASLVDDRSCHSSPTRIPPTSTPHVSHFPVPIPPILSAKRISRRIYLSHASLLHVNGTYLQEGTYCDAPLFVRVGPPRKFMGKWDCAVVLRRELVVGVGKSSTKHSTHSTSTPSQGTGAMIPSKREGQPDKEEYIWKIGLVPAHRITHPRLIGYYFAKEGHGSGKRMFVRMSNRMSKESGRTMSKDATSSPTKKKVKGSEESDDWMEEDHYESFYEPPVEGWRVFQSDSAMGSNARVSGLKVSYEE